MRQQLIPSAFAGSGAQVYVGGKTADEADYFHAVTSPTPYVLVFVLGLSFLLLLLAFRSLTIAAVSILLTLVFIHGAGVGIFGFQKVPVIDAWVPLNFAPLASRSPSKPGWLIRAPSSPLRTGTIR